MIAEDNHNQVKMFEDSDMIVHKPESSCKEYLAETASWEAQVHQIINEPFFNVPKGLTREEMRDWVRKCAAGEIEGNA